MVERSNRSAKVGKCQGCESGMLAPRQGPGWWKCGYRTCHRVGIGADSAVGRTGCRQSPTGIRRSHAAGGVARSDCREGVDRISGTRGKIGGIEWRRHGRRDGIGAWRGAGGLRGCEAGTVGSAGRASCEQSGAGARVVLVFGNAKYESSAIGRLENPVRCRRQPTEQRGGLAGWDARERRGSECNADMHWGCWRALG